MAYDPATDFLGLLRLTGGGVRSERMPGLDWLVSALNRMGLFAVSIGQTAPVANQATTVWIKPALPSWSAEGAVYLWSAVLGAYAPATPALWQAFLTPSGAIFQSLPDANNIIDSGVSLAAVQRAAPANTAITLPTIAAQYASQKSLRIVDFSTGVAAHNIALTTSDGATIMQEATWHLLSSADQLAGVTLTPSPDLNAWVIAP